MKSIREKGQIPMQEKMTPSSGFRRFKLDLGLMSLISDWKALFTRQFFKDDLKAAFLVAGVSLPLSLAIAMASETPPTTGLITAIVGGLIFALWGGTPLAVNGPSHAMPVILAVIAQNYGLSGLLIVGFGCGILQLLTGVLRLGQLVRLIPFPVTAGLTAGIGAILLISLLPKALGLPAPDESHIFDVISHIHQYTLQTQPTSLILATSALLMNLLLPRLAPKLPAPLISLIASAIIVKAAGIQPSTLEDSLTYISSPHWSDLSFGNFLDLLSASFAVFAIACMETFLSTKSAEDLSDSLSTDPDQDQIAQGMSNLILPFVGGIPATGLIARTALNIRAGAKTRRAAIFQSLILLVCLLLFPSFINQIPIATLVGIMLSVALRMLHPREFFRIWNISHTEALIYSITFFAVIIFDLYSGIQTGLGIALIIALVRLNRSQTQMKLLVTPDFHELTIDGPLTFLMSGKIEQVRSQIQSMRPDEGLVVNCAQIDSMDSTGAQQLIEFLEPILETRVVVLLGLKPELCPVLIGLDKNGKIAPCLVSSESEMMSLLNQRSAGNHFERLVYGVTKFSKDIKHGYDSLFKDLAESQSPHTLFITCSDSRINPNLITSTHPGELFIVRNVGNIIPPYGEDLTPAEGAAVEFAVGVLGVKEIVVCGHSGCGAMKEILWGDLLKSEKGAQFPSLMNWLQLARQIKSQIPPNSTLQHCTEVNAVLQLENLKSYPLIREKLQKGEIRLHAWYYNIGESELEEWDESKRIFVTIGSKAKKELEDRINSGVQFQASLNQKKRS